MQENNSQKFVPISIRDKITTSERTVLNLWKKNEDEWLRTNQIITLLGHTKFSETKVHRYLKRLEKKGLVEKKRDRTGKRGSYYRILAAPKEFTLFDYVDELRVQSEPCNMLYEWQLGGLFSSIAQGAILSFPDVSMVKIRSDEREILTTLISRMGILFYTLRSLRNAILLRTIGIPAPIDGQVVKEYVIESLASELSKSDSEHWQIYNKFEPLLSNSKRAYAKIYRERMKKSEVLPQFELLDLLTINDYGFEYLQQRKESMRKAGINVDRIKTKDFFLEWISIHMKMRDSAQVFQRKLEELDSEDKAAAYMEKYGEDLSKRESSLRTALLIKIMDAFHKKGIRELNEMALVISPHQYSTFRYYDAERMVYESIEGIKRFNKKIKPATREFATEVGEDIARSRSLTMESLQSLKEKNWFKKEVGADNFEHLISAFMKKRGKK